MLRSWFGAAVRRARAERGITQREAAALAGVSYQLISQIETGRVNTTVDTIEAIADALGIELVLVSEGSRPGVARRFLAVLPNIPEEELDVFVHELALWERRYQAKKRK